MKINHSYKIKYKPITRYEYEEYESGIGTTEYKDRIEPLLPSVWEKLNANKYSRQAVITLNRPDFMSCLLSYQMQLVENTIYVTVNMRSQAHEYRTRDTQMILYWTTNIVNHLEYLISAVDISVNVANYHAIKERK